MLLKEGMIVKSLAGHDAGRYYLIVKVSEKQIWLVDGKRRTVDRPKCKNAKHLQKTNGYTEIREYTNNSIKKLLHEWNYPKNKP